MIFLRLSFARTVVTCTVGKTNWAQVSLQTAPNVLHATAQVTVRSVLSFTLMCCVRTFNSLTFSHGCASVQIGLYYFSLSMILRLSEVMSCLWTGLWVNGGRLGRLLVSRTLCVHSRIMSYHSYDYRLPSGLRTDSTALWLVRFFWVSRFFYF